MDSFWRDFWFAPGSPLWLGVQRAFYCAVVFCNVLPECRYRFLSLDRVFHQPAFPLKFLPLPSARVGRGLELLWKVALLMASLGLATRPSLALAALLSLYWFSLPNQFGVQHHRNHVTVQILLILALSHCGDGFSLDSLIFGGPLPGHGGEYTWPSRMICICLTAMFGAAGWTKLRWSGPAWVKTLPLYLVRALCLPYDARPLSRWNLWLSRRRWCCWGGAALVLLLECLSPAGLLGFLPGLKIFLLFPLGILLSLAGIRFLLGPAFANVAAAHVFWLTPGGAWDGQSGPGWLLWLAGLLLLPTACAWLLQREIFPFSHYPMYAGPCGSVLERRVLYGVTERGDEVELWDHNQPLLSPLDRWTMHLHLLGLKAPERRQRALCECLRLVADNGLKLRSVRVYQARWEFGEGQVQPPQPRLTLWAELEPRPGPTA